MGIDLKVTDGQARERDNSINRHPGESRDPHILAISAAHAAPV
jgi:hypothetical protein